MNLRQRLICAMIFGAIALFSFAYAAKPWDGTYSAFKGEYLIYAGALGEEAPPSTADRKAAFALHGEVARSLFESIGPDLKNGCGASSGIRLRQKGDLDCTYDKGDNPAPYVCHFGIDLRTGKSMYGSIC